MDVVRLTNLGNLTLGNLLALDKKYAENAGQKRKKLSQLWASEQAMDSFQGLFTQYHSTSADRFLVRGGESYFLRDTQSQIDAQLDQNTAQLIDEFSDLGLVRFTPATNSLEETIASLQKDRTANPARDLNRAIVELTGACNLTCGHCYRGGSRRGEYGLSAEKIKEALTPLLRAGIRGITVTGGEPTLRRKDLLDMIGFASQYLELKGVSAEERLRAKYKTSTPTIDDVLNTPKFVSLKERLMAQLSVPKDRLFVGDWNICDQNTPKDVDELLRQDAEAALKYDGQVSAANLDRLAVLSNGFFDSPRELVRTLKAYGVSMQISLDSFNETTTDQNRGRPGVFRRVKELATIAREEGFDLDICAQDIGGTNTHRERANRRYFERRAEVWVLGSGMYQIGNAVRSGFSPGTSLTPHNYLGSLSPDGAGRDGWCTGWTAPKDIHIKPTGVVGNCLLAYAVPEEFGNLRQTPMADIINEIQNSRVYAMFTDGSIERYQHELDPSLFPEVFKSSCEVMAITLTYGAIKERLIAHGVRNPVAIANRAVAKIYKL